MKKAFAIFLLFAIMFIMKTVAFGQTTSTTNTVRTFAANGDTLLTTTKITTEVSVIVKKFVPGSPPPIMGTNPGGKSSNPVQYSNLNGTLITGLSFDGAGATKDLLTLNDCQNVHVTLCRFSNTGARAVVLNNCTNCTVDFCFFTMVGFGIDAISCVGTKANFNQGLNLWQPAIYNNNFAHWIQFYKCSGAGQQVNNNKLLCKDGVALHPHDNISIDATSGTTSSPIQIHDNLIKGGQIAGGFPKSTDTGVGLTAPDENGNNYDIRRNTVVNCGVNGIIVVATGSNIVIDSNIMVNDNRAMKLSYDGFTISGTKSNMIVSNNRARWIRPDGTYLGLWLGASGKTTFPGVTFINNNWNDTSLTSAILKDSMITYK